MWTGLNRNEYQESSWGGKGRPACKADNLTAICEPTVYKTWEPQPLTTLRAFMACYRDSFTLSHEDVSGNAILTSPAGGSGQLHAPSALRPVKQPQVPTGLKAG
jgi:hypothetical protein